jgi:hypothetical protein
VKLACQEASSLLLAHLNACSVLSASTPRMQQVQFALLVPLAPSMIKVEWPLAASVALASSALKLVPPASRRAKSASLAPLLAQVAAPNALCVMLEDTR